MRPILGPHSGHGFSVTSDEADRFWARVDRSENCWLWTGSVNHGYGIVSIKSVRNGSIRAHRVAFAIAHGGLQPGVVVMHACDNKRCVNPAHLQSGTQGDNYRDAVAKGLRTYRRATTCKRCNAPRWERFQMPLCRHHYLEHQRSYYYAKKAKEAVA